MEEEGAGGDHVKAVAALIIIDVVAPSGNRINTKREFSKRARGSGDCDRGENGLFGLHRLTRALSQSQNIADLINATFSNGAQNGSQFQVV